MLPIWYKSFIHMCVFYICVTYVLHMCYVMFHICNIIAYRYTFNKKQLTYVKNMLHMYLSRGICQKATNHYFGQNDFFAVLPCLCVILSCVKFWIQNFNPKYLKYAKFKRHISEFSSL